MILEKVQYNFCDNYGNYILLNTYAIFNNIKSYNGYVVEYNKIIGYSKDDNNQLFCTEYNDLYSDYKGFINNSIEFSRSFGVYDLHFSFNGSSFVWFDD